MEVKPVVLPNRGTVERRFHRAHVAVVEGDRLQIGQAPPDFAKGWRNGDGLAIGGERIVQPANRLEQMGHAHPYLGLVRVPV